MDVLSDAERAIDSLRLDAETLALPYTIAGAHWQQAQIAYQRGDLARCELEARAAIEAGGESTTRLTTPWPVMALAEQGSLEAAERLLDAAGLWIRSVPRAAARRGRQPRATTTRAG